MKRPFSLALLGLSIAVTSITAHADGQSSLTPTSEVVQQSDIDWGYLNPLRGDQSPAAGDLWGDRTKDGASGFLVKFNEGFSSPPHIHNITYRGVVIQGEVHNDDKNADEQWLPAGSFWIQPAGESHITAARDEVNMAYIEIDEGPYLVQPESEAFHNDEEPLNVAENNLVWLDANDIRWISLPGSDDAVQGPKTAFLWGNPDAGQMSGRLVKLPADFSVEIASHADEFRAVVIKGDLTHETEGKNDSQHLTTGSYFGSQGEITHDIATSADGETLLYVRTNGDFDIVEQ